MAFVYQTTHFEVTAPERPHVDRLDGGHLRIAPKVALLDRTQLTPELATECMLLTMLCGEAMTAALRRRGIDIGRINYQDNGNWNATFHIHLYGRATTASVQKYGEALRLPFRETGFYDSFQPLNAEDIAEIQSEIARLVQMEKYQICRK